MDTTPVLGLPLMAEGQGGSSTLYNEAMTILDTATGGGSGAGVPGGSANQAQYKIDGVTFGGSSGLTLNATQVTGITLAAPLPVVQGGTGANTVLGAQTALAVRPGVEVQAYDAELTALAGLTSAADRLPYFTGAGSAALSVFTAAARAFLDDPDAATQRLTLGLQALATKNTVATPDIDNNAVTYPKLQNVSAPLKILGRYDTGAGVVQELTLGSGLSVDGSGNITAGGLTTEEGQDTVAAMLPPSASLDCTCNDPAGWIAAEERFNCVTERHVSFAYVTADNATTGQHGLLRKLSGSATQYLNGVGAWTTPAGGSATFLDLTDVLPSTYVGQAGKGVIVNGAETGVDFGTASTGSYDLGLTWSGTLPASQVLMRYPFPRSVDFPAGLTGSRGVSAVAATATTTLDLRKNGTSVGSVQYAAGATTATFTMASPTTFAAGDVLTVHAPASADATLADLGLSLAGTRSVAPGEMGSTTWLGLTDTDPTTYTGQGGKVTRVNAGATGLEFGPVLGTMAQQLDKAVAITDGAVSVGGRAPTGVLDVQTSVVASDIANRHFGLRLWPVAPSGSGGVQGIRIEPMTGPASTTAYIRGVSIQDQPVTSGGATGIESGLSAGTGRLNINAYGTASNYFGGGVGIGIIPTGVLDVQGNVQASDAVNQYFALRAWPSAPTAAVASVALRIEPTTGAGISTTAFRGVQILDQPAGMVTTYGFHSFLSSGTGRYHIYPQGTAPCYFGGAVQVVGSGTFSSNLDITGNVGIGGGNLGTVKLTVHHANATVGSYYRHTEAGSANAITFTKSDFTPVGSITYTDSATS